MATKLNGSKEASGGMTSSSCISNSSREKKLIIHVLISELDLLGLLSLTLEKKVDELQRKSFK